MQSDFQEGWEKASAFLAGQTATFVGDRCGEISTTIQTLQNDINAFVGFKTGIGQLSGDAGEFWVADSHNINAALKGSLYSVNVDRSHGLASADLTSNWGEDFGLKFMKDAQGSANAQSTSVFQKFKEYQYSSHQPNLSFDDYLSIKGLSEDTVMHDPLYSGQTRIIPSDQYEEARKYLEFKIAKEEMTRPDQVERYKETLEKLKRNVIDPDGITSADLTKDEAKELAKQGKENSYKSDPTKYTQDGLIQIKDIVDQGLKAGATAASITFAMKIAPEIIKIIQDAINDGDVNIDRLKEKGLAAMPDTILSFCQGFVASSLVFAYQSGNMGTIFSALPPNMLPGVIGTFSAIVFSTIKDSILLSQGKITRQEFIVNLNRATFVGGCAIGFGWLVQFICPMLPGAYFIGNAVGTLIGTISFKFIDDFVMSLAIKHGYTFFGIVEQDYELPEEIIHELGFDRLNIDTIEIETNQYDEVQFDSIDYDEMDVSSVKLLKRGVYKIHHVGYLYQ